MNVTVIACIDSAGGISRGGTIPWNIQEDKDYFMNTITRKGQYPNIIVMGRKTFEQMGAVKDQLTIVISKTLPSTFHRRDDSVDTSLVSLAHLAMVSKIAYDLSPCESLNDLLTYLTEQPETRFENVKVDRVQCWLDALKERAVLFEPGDLTRLGVVETFLEDIIDSKTDGFFIRVPAPRYPILYGGKFQNEKGEALSLIVIPDIEELYEILEKLHHNEVFICGGSEIYKYFISQYDSDESEYSVRFLINKIDHDYNCDNKIEFSWGGFHIPATKDKEMLVVDKSTGSIVTLTIFRDKSQENPEEQAYLDLMYSLIEGEKVESRNGLVYEGFGATLKFDLSRSFPLLTTKKMDLSKIFEELMFFLRGQTDTNILKEKGVHIWDANTSKEFLAQRGLDYPEGVMGPLYGHCFREFGKPYVVPRVSNPRVCFAEGILEEPDSGVAAAGVGSKPLVVKNEGFDQIAYVMNLLKTDPKSRRILMTSFDPSTANKCVLYPCHSLLIQFHTRKIKSFQGHTEYFLDVMQTQRSGDSFLGVPYNIGSHALLVHLICHVVNNDIECKNKYKPGNLIMNLGNYHVYEDHFNQVRKQYLRRPYYFPQLVIKGKVDRIEDFEFENIELINYTHHPGIKAVMVP